jgi:hypothetical protein
MFYMNDIHFILTFMIQCCAFLIFDTGSFEKDLPLSQNKHGIVR